MTAAAPAEDWDTDEDLTGGIGSIQGNHNISVTDPRGSVVVMEQVAFHLRSAAAEAGTGWTPRLVPEDILTSLDERFVPPPGYGDLVTRLRKPGTVVVTGAPGRGRRSAALMVLKDSGDGATRFRELPDEDVDDRLVLDENAIEPGERLLLDLSAETTPISPRTLATLRAYRAAVADRQSYLAIVLPSEQQRVATELGVEATVIARPDATEVFRRHLTVFGITVSDQDLRTEALRRHLALDPMRDIATLAERVRRAWAAGQDNWLAAALETDRYLDDVARLVRDNPDGRVRALLLATAVFEHTTPEAVESAATTFLEITKYPPPEGHRLDLPDLAEALSRIHATIDDHQVRFDSVAYGDAVRTHFWRTFPGLRSELRQWLDRVVRSTVVSPAGRSLAVLRYTDQCLRTGHPLDLCRLVERWAASSPLLDVAGAALTRGLLNERYGRWFRRKVYDWAVNRPSPNLATLLVGLTENVIAPAQPHQALVRLRHLTRHPHPEVVTEARAALTRLGRDGRFARRLLTRVHEDLVGDHPRDVDYALFADVADPVRLTASEGFPQATEPPVRTMLVEAWSAWLTKRPYEETAEAVARWLTAHAENPTREALLEILAAATHGRSPQRAVLYAASRDWAADQHPDRLRTAARLRQACAEVQPHFESRTAEGASN